MERFDNKEKEKGIKAAKWGFIKDVLLLFRPGIIKSFHGNYQLNNYAMFRNYFKIGWRNLLKYRSYSTINIIGLSAGFGATLLLLLIINYENSYDKFHADHNQIFRVGTHYSSGDIEDMIVTPQIPLMGDEYPEIVRAIRFLRWFCRED